MEATAAQTAEFGCCLPVPFFPMLLLPSACSNFWSETSFEVQTASDSLLCFGQQVNKWTLPREAVTPLNTGNFYQANTLLTWHDCILKYSDSREKGERPLSGRVYKCWRWEEKIHSRWYRHPVVKWILSNWKGLPFQEHLKLQATLKDPSNETPTCFWKWEVSAEEGSEEGRQGAGTLAIDR